MRIVVNGIPKSGTHALLKALDLNRQKVGARYAQHGHFPYPEVDTVHNQHLFIVRNPRNCIISSVRMDKLEVNEASILDKIFHFGSGMDFQGYSDTYAPWLVEPNTHVLTYEGLMSDITVLQGVCKFVGIPYIDGSFEAFPLTWTLTHNPIASNWKDYWTPNIDAVWQEHGLAFEKLWETTNSPAPQLTPVVIAQ